MIIAGSCYDRPAVFRYESDDLKSWKYAGILYGETDPQYGIAECPDFFYLDGTWVLIVSYIYADGRKDGRDVVWYTGTYKDGKFDPENKGLLDEGKDYYAPQSFEVEGERISAGWNCHRLGAAYSTAGKCQRQLKSSEKISSKKWKTILTGNPTDPGTFYRKSRKRAVFPFNEKDKRNKGKYSSFSGWITGRKGKSVYW